MSRTDTSIGLGQTDVVFSPDSPAAAAPSRRRRRRRSILPAFVLLAVVGGGGYGGWRWWESRQAVTKVERASHVVRRADLPISVTEGGNVKALHSEDIKCMVEGKTTIISLVPEGSRITEEDVEKGKVLVELDSADLRERLTQQEITHANAESAYEAAREDFEIEKSDTESKIKNGELNVKFGRMDLEHFVGQQLAVDALGGKMDLLKLGEQLHEAAVAERKSIETESAKALKEVEAALAAPPEEGPLPKSSPARRPEESTPAASDDERLADVTGPGRRDEMLGGQALQTKRKLDADIELAIEKFKRAADKLSWTARLEKKGFVSHNELEADQLALKSSLIDLQQALSARELFLRYEFPKKAEEFLSIYVERGKELERIRARGRAAISQAQAKLKSAESTFKVQKTRFEKLKKQIKFCIIRATKPGLVVYATSGGHFRGGGTPIEEGATVYERQSIIKLPDVTQLAVEVDVHESVVDKVTAGLEANIRIDAFPNAKLKGKVLKVAVLPDSASRWMNPDLKQYQTDVNIEGKHAYLKPGMSAEVEILVGLLENVIQIPVQAVTNRRGKSVVYVVRGSGEEEREVELGESNDKFVQVLKGLEEGETILLEAPQSVTVEEQKAEDEAKQGDRPKGPPKLPGPDAGKVRRPSPDESDPSKKGGRMPRPDGKMPPGGTRRPKGGGPRPSKAPPGSQAIGNRKSETPWPPSLKSATSSRPT